MRSECFWGKKERVAFEAKKNALLLGQKRTRWSCPPPSPKVAKFCFFPKACAMFWNVCKNKFRFVLLTSFKKMFILSFWDLRFCEPDSETLRSDTNYQIPSWFRDSTPKYAVSRGTAPVEGVGSKVPHDPGSLPGVNPLRTNFFFPISFRHFFFRIIWNLCKKLNQDQNNFFFLLRFWWIFHTLQHILRKKKCPYIF